MVKGFVESKMKIMFRKYGPRVTTLDWQPVYELTALQNAPATACDVVSFTKEIRRIFVNAQLGRTLLLLTSAKCYIIRRVKYT